jgi:4'-phosphopantetheinyl transferase EntD
MSRVQLRSSPGPTEPVVDAPAFAAAVRAGLPVALRVALAFAQPADHRGELFTEELAAMTRAANRRVHEYSTGRALARGAMTALGLAPGAITRGAGREPCWPSGCIGSITHAHGLVAAAVTRAGDLRGLGIDLELTGRLRPELHRKILTERERTEAGGDVAIDPLTATLAFSAKESVYKAVNPIVRRFIGFQEVEVAFAGSGGRGTGAFPAEGIAPPDSGSFRMRYVGEHAANRIMEAGEGWYLLRDGYVFTLFAIS